MSQADREVARTIRDFRRFFFQCPKKTSERVYRLKMMRCYGVLVWAFVVFVLGLLIYGLLISKGW